MSEDSRRRRASRCMEVLIAVTLLSLLSVGMLFAMRIGLTAFAQDEQQADGQSPRGGAQRILEQELQG